MITKYIDQILKWYNFFDGIIVTDENAFVQYYANVRGDIFKFSQNEIIGKSILDIYPNLTSEKSSIFKAIQTGQPIHNQYQRLITQGGKELNIIYSTFPIKENGKIIGVVDISTYCDIEKISGEITLMLDTAIRHKNLYTLSDIITQSKKMESLKRWVSLISNTDSPVMLFGETGTGKELFAQSIHSEGSRASKKFVSQNCAAIPPTLAESVFFGTTKGSYTDAKDQPGLFEIADGGTLFLDEINSMDFNMQSKLLRALEAGEVSRIGSVKHTKFNVRIVSAINMDPLECLQQGFLREDLYYRLNTVQLDIPPLRERTDDIPLLIEYFIHYFNEKMNKKISDIDMRTKKCFLSYHWPGNVRELRNVMERGFNLSSGSLIEYESLPAYLQNYSSSPEDQFSDITNLQTKLDEYEKKIIVEALSKNISHSQTAKSLGLSRQTFQYKLKKYNLV